MAHRYCVYLQFSGDGQRAARHPCPDASSKKNSLEVSRLRSDGSYAVGDVSGLYLKIEGGSRARVFRYVHDGHRRRMGLAATCAVTCQKSA